MGERSAAEGDDDRTSDDPCGAVLEKLGSDELAKGAPLQRIGDNEDLKGVAVLFASDAGKHITGQTLAVDGGVSAV